MHAFMQTYKLPSGEFATVATRFPLPVRELAFSPSGSSLAAAGDDEAIKLISLSNQKVCIALSAASDMFCQQCQFAPSWPNAQA